MKLMDTELQMSKFHYFCRTQNSHVSAFEQVGLLGYYRQGAATKKLVTDLLDVCLWGCIRQTVFGWKTCFWQVSHRLFLLI